MSVTAPTVSADTKNMGDAVPGRTSTSNSGRRASTVAHRFKHYLRGRVRTVLTAAAALIAFTAMRLLEPWPIKMVIDNILLGRPQSERLSSVLQTVGADQIPFLYLLVAAILVIAFAGGFFYYHLRILTARLGIQITAELRRDLFQHIQYLSLAFHDRRRTGDLLVRLTADIRLLRDACVSLPLDAMQALLIIVGMTVIMALMDWQLTLLALVLLPAIGLLIRRYHRPLKTAAREQRQREGELASIASEALGAIRAIQGLRREAHEIDRFSGSNKKTARSEVKAARYEAKMRWAADIVIALITAIVVLIATRRILANSLSPGDLIVFLAYLRAFMRPIRRVSGATRRVARATAAGERVLQILDAVPDVRDAPQATVAAAFSGQLTFEQVSFSYPKGQLVLSNIDLDVSPGERVAIVGQTGAGKSTLVSLIPRFIDPTEGQVCIDGQNIRDLTLESLRSQISFVFQDPVLFATTIAENIAYGKPDATIDEVREVARKAGIDGHISNLADGYDTIVGERGATLSGGQRQCVAIARAMIGGAPIVILDELTTGLDEVSADLVLNALNVLMQGRTVIIISHDRRVMAHADRMVTIENGRILDKKTFVDPPSGDEPSAQSELPEPRYA